ncbi:MAG: hypothetical protein G3M78_05640 [Candidatus Nitrohelix vancouverensis]|uniref:Glycosyltransferase RgtA/B/C/D-like domain-containing protein n=1 Tax=Candidatus Nitrohelix vancouverensis TaxID=2705534 RepID=A0A7T0G329_9BACT|nr:MAG: hypothetical protein G3M78_05640 [Candidatus Nitrohelix vancouverensis]
MNLIVSEDNQTWTLRDSVVWFLLFLILLTSNLALRYPLLINAEMFMNGDEAFVADKLILTLEGQAFTFYYEDNRYVGALIDFLVVPFIWLLGPVALAFKTAIVFMFSLYAWTLCLLVRQIDASLVGLTAVLTVLVSPAVMEISVSFMPHVLIGVLGNISFLLLTKLIRDKDSGKWTVFLLCAVSGAAVYVYTYSVLFIASIIGIVLLTDSRWPTLREKISFSFFRSLFLRLNSKREKIARGFDVLMILFLCAILFAYVFGGFGFDIGGVTLFQINNLHKPVGQLAVLIVLRVLIYRKDISNKWRALRSFVDAMAPETRQALTLGVCGFLIGISPRIASIASGETKRGGQGFDMDFMPLRLLQHLWELLLRHVPELIGAARGLRAASESGHVTALTLVSGVVMFLVVFAIAAYFKESWAHVKQLLCMRPMVFTPHLFFIFYPLIVCGANIATQNGPLIRYLLPLYGAIVFWLAWFMIRIRQKSMMLFVAGLMAWMYLSMDNLHQFYSQKDILRGATPVIRVDPAREVINFAKANSIPLVYSRFVLASRVSFFSRQTIHVAEYTRSPKGKLRNRTAMNIPVFCIAIPINSKSEQKHYELFFQENGVSFQRAVLEHHIIYWDFEGQESSINQLRSMFP